MEYQNKLIPMQFVNGIKKPEGFWVLINEPPLGGVNKR